MNIFPRNTARGAEITPADNIRNLCLQVAAYEERLMRGEHEANDPGPLMSIARERERLDAKRKTDNWARNHP